MKAREAVTQVENTVFKPGWHPVVTYAGLNTVEIGFVIDTVDTSYPAADGSYPVPKTLRPTRTVNVSLMGPEDLSYELLKFAAEIDEHENREFLRIRQPGGSWEAPLHPHTLGGELTWQLLKRGSHPSYR